MQHSHNHPGAPTEALPQRRTFFWWLTYGLGAVAGAVMGIPFVGYLIRIRQRPADELWVKLGPVSKFPSQQTRLETFSSPLKQPWDGLTGQTGVYVRYEGKDEAQKDQFLVFSVNCAHLGCGVSWFPQSGLFMCPCHGGVYYANGDRASGPPPGPLFKCDWRVRAGQLEVQAPHYPTEQNPLVKEPAKPERG
jgi:menaquinol-cytochrome c reductase iron-sulfur subunit